MSRYDKGMTLIELLIVVAMIGILSGIAITQFYSAIRRTRVNRTLTELRSIMNSMDIYMIDHDHYPIQGNFIDLAEVVSDNDFAAYYRGAVNDPWGKPFRYRTDPSGVTYMIKSFGADKVHNNTTGDFENPETWVGPECVNVSIRTDFDAVVEKGCDIVFLNGELAEKFD